MWFILVTGRAGVTLVKAGHLFQCGLDFQISPVWSHLDISIIHIQRQSYQSPVFKNLHWRQGRFQKSKSNLSPNTISLVLLSLQVKGGVCRLSASCVMWPVRLRTNPVKIHQRIPKCYHKLSCKILCSDTNNLWSSVSPRLIDLSSAFISGLYCFVSVYVKTLSVWRWVTDERKSTSGW